MTGLPRQVLSMPFGQGLDTKRDERIIGDRLLALENAVFTKAGALQKRNGYKQLVDSGWSKSSSLPFPGTLATFNSELALAGGGSLNTFDSATGNLRNKGALRSLKVTTEGVYSDEYDQTSADCATGGGVTLYAFESTALGGAVYAVAVDEATGARLSGVISVGTGYSKPTVVYAAGWFYIFFLQVDSLLYVRANAATPTTFSAPATLFSHGMSSTPYYSVVAFGTNLLLTWADNTNAINLQYFNPRTGAMGTVATGYWQTASVAGAPFTQLQALSLVNLNDQYAYLLWANNGSMNATVYNRDLTLARATVSIESVSTSIKNATGVRTSATASSIVCLYEVAPGTGSPNYNSYVRRATVGPLSGSITPATVYRSVGLATKAFADQYGTPMVGLVYDSTVQGQVFFAQFPGGLSPTIVGKCFSVKPGGAASAGLTGYPKLPSVVSSSTGVYLAALISKTAQVSAAGAVTFSTKHVFKAVVDVSSERFRSAQLGQNLHLCGGVLSDYDGSFTFEHGFHVFPERATASYGGFGLSVSQWPKTGSVPQIVQITPPPDDSFAQPVIHSGARVRPGSYLILSDAETPGPKRLVLWFTVDGAGSNPLVSDTGSLPQQVSLLSTDTQAMVAQRIRDAILSGVTLPVFAPTMTAKLGTSGTDSVVLVTTQGTTQPIAAPVDDTSLGYSVTQMGSNTQPEKTRLTFPAASWISSGQWFLLESSYKDSTSTPNITTNTQVQFWFKVGGVGSAPALPDGVTMQQEVDIASTATPQQVASAVQSAISSYQRSAKNLWTATATAEIVDIACIQSAGTYSPNYGTIGLTQNGGTRYNVGGSIASGSRLYYAIYEWFDARGQYHRSAPSVPISALSGAKDIPGSTSGDLGIIQTTSASNVVSVSTLRLTAKPATGGSPGTSVKIGLFRTASGGSLAYRVATLSNDPTVDSVSYTDSADDSTLLANEPLYTAGGEVPNFPPPSCSLLATHQNRLFVAGLDDGNSVWLSKQSAEGYGVAFSPLLTLRMDPAGGPITALAVLDEKLVIFKRSRIFVMSGTGPDATGLNGNYSTPQALSTDVGCTNPDSVVLTPRGLMFQSAKGIYLLNRSLEPVYLGMPVEVYGTQSLTAAHLLDAYSQVRFLSDTGTTLVYDYLFDQWGVFTNHQGVGAALWNGSYCYVTTSGVIRQETPGAYLDVSEPIRLYALTPWLAPAGRQGFCRARSAQLVGSYLSKHNLQADVAYDYDPAVVGRYNFNATAALGSNAYGTQSPYGTGTYGGTTDPGSYQVEIQLARQKCQSVRFAIYDVPSPSGGASFTLADLELLWSPKQLDNRLPATRRIG